jgi:hypothetical protein
MCGGLALVTLALPLLLGLYVCLLVLPLLGKALMVSPDLPLAFLELLTVHDGYWVSSGSFALRLLAAKFGYHSIVLLKFERLGAVEAVIEVGQALLGPYVDVRLELCTQSLLDLL